MSDDPIRSPLRRRLMVLRLAALGGAAAVPGVAGAQGPKSGGPGAPAPPRSGLTDSDPSDEPGNGRTGNRAPQAGQSDSDPTDPPGQGRGRSGDLKST
jgi:translation initiation factor IF-2